MTTGLNDNFVRTGLDCRIKEVVQMTKPGNTKECEHPERLKGKPGECSPQQIKECHGEGGGHPCVEKK